jgi:hypothetical protein
MELIDCACGNLTVSTYTEIVPACADGPDYLVILDPGNNGVGVIFPSFLHKTPRNTC